MNWVTSTDLKIFARHLESRSILPYFVRELITSTSKEGVISKIDFPYKEDVDIGGLDGELICSEGTIFIPEGHSVWEFGQRGDVKDKADEDYDKRTAEPEGYEPGETTFVFVTARLYRNKNTWIQTKKNLNQWKDIKFYDAADLEKWFNESPVVSSQLSKEGIGSFPSTVKALDLYWDEWCLTGTIKFNHEILLAGREIQKNYITQFLQNLIPDPAKRSRLIIKCNSNEEATAFICAVIETLDRDEKSSCYSKSILIKDEKNYDYIINKKSPHVIINETGNLISINYGCSKNHKIIVPILNHDNLKHDIEINNLDKDTFSAELRKLNVSDENCELYFTETSGDLLRLKLRLV